MEITEGLPLARWGDLVVGEGVQRITVHQVEVEEVEDKVSSFVACNICLYFACLTLLLLV